MNPVMKIIFLAVITHCIWAQPIVTDSGLDWWQSGVIYQIYPRSFKDSNGDGIGDLNGITEKADYLKDLGVTAIWLSPIFKSPMADFGYDISDFRAIEPIFGTIEDFIRLKEAFHKRGIRIIMDFVPNHSSDEHEWFQKSVQNIEPYSDYYVWRDAKMENGIRSPPNNWLSYFGGSAWTWNENRQKYYLHQYHPKQPDFDYRNPLVMQEMKEILKHWTNLGVDGFRVDTVFTLVEDDRFLDEPRSFLEDTEPTNIGYLRHIYTKDQPGTYDVIYQFREFLDSISAKTSSTIFMATEAYSTMEDTMRYYGNATHRGAHFPFNFLFTTDVDRQSDAELFQKVINSWYSNMPSGHWANWVIGNHDRPRATTRFGRSMIDSIHIIQFLLQGTVITYMGDEIGMENTYIRWVETVDPPGLNGGIRMYERYSRDPARAPFLWNDSVSAGFSSKPKTWLPVNPDYWDSNLEKQLSSPKSHVSVYKRLLRLKTVPAIQYGTVKVRAFTKDILVIERSYQSAVVYIGLVNTGSSYENLNLTQFVPASEKKFTVYAASVNCEYRENQEVDIATVNLRPKAGLVLTNDKDAPSNKA